MSCFASNYNPLPPRTWTRFENRCIEDNTLSSEYSMAMARKANILQYKGNRTILTKKQTYSQIARGKWTNRTTTWATQSDTHTNPNTRFLRRVNGVLTNITPINGQTNITSSSKVINSLCPSPAPINNNPSLPSNGGGGGKTPVVPPPPVDGGGGKAPFPPIQPIPSDDIIVVPDGGNLLCDVIENPCTGEIMDRTYTNVCFPTSDSDVPGPITLLCWNGSGKKDPVYYPRTRRTYA